jgi:uncharacterized membrane protein
VAVTGAPLIEPNLHAALVHFPIALIAMGVLLEVLGWLWPRCGARSAGRWMLVLGIFSCIPVITTGLYAMSQTVNPGGMQGEAWSVVAGNATWTDAHWEVMADHIFYMAIGTAVLLVCIVIWIAASDNARSKIHVAGMLLILAATGMILYGSDKGGKLVYHHSTGVGVVETSAMDTVAKEGVSSIRHLGDIVSPMELHTLAAGLTIAFIAAALGLSVRRSNVAWENRMAEEKAVAAGYRPAGQLGQQRNLLSIPTIYPGWFWIFAIVLGACTFAIGLWLIGMWRPSQILADFAHDRAEGNLRAAFHGWSATSILTLCVLLGIILRFFPRRRFFMGVFSTLLVLALATQVWTGILLLLDGPEGSVFQFRQVPAMAPKRIDFSTTEPTTRSAQPTIPIPDGTPGTDTTPETTAVPETLPVER